MTDWTTETKYEPAPPSEAERHARAHRAAALRNPAKAAAHNLAASILTQTTPTPAQAPRDDYAKRYKAWAKNGGDPTKFLKE